MWKKLFPAIFMLACVDGFFSNWLFPAKFPLLFKDIFILLVYVLFILQITERNLFAKFKRSIGFGTLYLAMLFALVGAMQIFNNDVPKIEVALVGFKAMFFYWPLALLGFAYVDDYQKAYSLMKKIVLFSIPICLFGIFQFWADPYFMVNNFGMGFARAIMLAHIDAEVDSFLRVFSTFASSGQFSLFLVINGSFILGLLFAAQKRSEKMLMGACLALNAFALLATGSRGSTLLLLLVTIAFMLLCKRVLKQVMIILLLGGIFYFAFNFLGKGVIARFETLKRTDMIRERTIEATKGIFFEYLEEYTFGRGMGTATGASRYLLTDDMDEQPVLIENYPSKLQYETGIIGVVLCYLVLLLLSRRLLGYALLFGRKHGDAIIAALSSFCLVVFVYSLFFVIDPPPQGIFLWAMVGMVAKMAQLKKDESSEEQQINPFDLTRRYI